MDDFTKEEVGSKFQLFIGLALTDKEKYSTKLKIHLTEMTPFVSGDLEEKDILHEVSSKSTNQSATIEISNIFECEYFSMFSNRLYPPDVKKGEQVFVIKYADSDDYYWFSPGRDDYLRRTERLAFGVSNLKKAKTTLSEEDVYFIEFDTDVNKHIVLKTSKSDNEPFQYILKMDAKNSRLHICDDDQNQILIDSNVPRVLMANKDGSFLDLSQKNATIFAPDDCTIKVGRQLVIDTPILTANVTRGAGAFKVLAKNVAINGSSSSVVKSPSIGLSGATITNSLMAKHVTAEGYSTGPVSSPSSKFSTRAYLTSSPSSFVSKPAISYPTDENSKIDKNDSMYQDVETNIASGTASSPNNSPKKSISGTDANRHCAAWEDVTEAFDAVIGHLNTLYGYHQSSLSDNISTHVENSKMPKNRGE